jgi:Putative metallopeptidase
MFLETIMRTAHIFALSLAILAPGLAAAQTASAPASDGARTNRVHIEYVPPTNAAHQPILDLMKERHVLERIQKLLSPFRLSRDLTLKVQGCGMNNAWYENGVITVCYEYLDNVRKNLPKETSKDGVTPLDALAAETYFVFLHETGHAMFDLLNVPVFGNEESAADQFASYILLQMGKDDARQLILGATYTFRPYMTSAETTEATVGFSDIHGTPAQRFFNVLCLGYGARPDVFGDLVAKGLLPKGRAQDCPFEYGSLAFAVGQLVKPFIDRQLAQQVLDETWLPPVTARPKRPSPPPQ